MAEYGFVEGEDFNPYKNVRVEKEGNRSKSEADLFTGRHKETEGHGYMPPTHQRNHTRNHR